jgi:predicted aldo/keto reductase-like oxidoreductase
LDGGRHPGGGAINLFNANVLRYAFDCGVNHFDTAEGYLNMNSEKMLGQALKDVRSKAIITSKYLLRTPADLLKKAVPAGIWEVVLFIYNHMEGPAIEPLVSEKQRYSQAAIRWTLGNPHINACIVTMSTFSHVDEYVAVSGTPLQRGDSPVLSHYRLEAGPHYCRVSCGQCLSACPKGVAVNEVLRYAMYFENYGMEKNAVDLYRQLDPARKPAACLSCVGPCEAACPHGLAVKAKLIRSHGLLAA